MIAFLAMWYVVERLSLNPLRQCNLIETGLGELTPLLCSPSPSSPLSVEREAHQRLPKTG